MVLSYFFKLIYNDWLSLRSKLANQLMNNFDSLLRFTGRLQEDLKLLQILRAWLKEETVQIVLDLLTNNKYLSYSGDKLEHLLKKEILFMYKEEQLS